MADLTSNLSLRKPIVNSERNWGLRHNENWDILDGEVNTNSVDISALTTSGSSHAGDATIHFTEGSVDHTAISNIGSNSHAAIDTHIADGTKHFTEGSIDHTSITNIGSNSHSAIDTHIADGTKHFSEASIDHTAITNIGTNSHSAIDTHIADGTKHFSEASIDHTAISNIGTNSHATIDSHIAAGTIHFTEGSIDHTSITNIGTNTHAQIDTHIATSSTHFTEGSIDHTAIANIGTNSHATIDSHISSSTIHFTEGSIDHTAIANIGTNSHASIDTHIADATKHFTEGSIDHGSIAGLSDDDHTQYSLAAGTRAFSGTVAGVTPTADAHLSTRLFVTTISGHLQSEIDAGPGGGAWQFLSSSGISNADTVELDLTGNFAGYMIKLKTIIPETDNTELFMRFSLVGDAAFLAGASDYSWAMDGENTAGGTSEVDASASEISLTRGASSRRMGTNTGENLCATIYLHNTDQNAVDILMESHVIMRDSGALLSGQHFRGGLSSTVATANVDAVQFLASADNLASGQVFLYGLKES